MKVFYRISPFKPDNPSVVYTKDKWKLVEYSHNSFLEAGGDMVDKVYILDSCDYWADYFKKYGEVKTINIHKKFAGLMLALNDVRMENGKVAIVEDDYLWRPNTIPMWEKSLDTLPVVSPYDHPAHYTEERFNDYPFKFKLIDNIVYRTCPSNTHTFATTADIIRNNWSCLVDDKKGEAYHDHPAFEQLNKVAQMWCPTYSFATHLAHNCLAPNIDWNLPVS